MTGIDLIFAALAETATIGGFAFEWRRQSRQREDAAAVKAQFAAIDERIAAKAQRDRVGS